MPFRDIVGHALPIRLLSRAVEQDVVPQSLIFAGPDGVGKRRTALALAQVLNCVERGHAQDACGACSPCRRIDRGVHPDVLIVEPGETGATKIEQVRAALDGAGYRPFEGRRRVIVFDRAENLVVPGQHALLKMLEEPPPASVLVLVTSRPASLLATVRSRCSLIRFGPLDAAAVAAVLVRDHDYSEREAAAIASQARGSVGLALDAARGEIGRARDAALALVRDVASAGPRARIEAARRLAGAAGAARERDQLASRLRALASLFRDLLVLAAGGAAGSIVNRDLVDELERLREAFPAGRTLRAFELVERALRALDRNANPKIVADWLAVRV